MTDFYGLITHLITVLGWTWEQAADFDLPRLFVLTAQWERLPPAAVSLALIGRALGAISAAPPSAAISASKVPSRDLGELMAMLPTIRPEGLDSSAMTPEQIQVAAEKLMFGQAVQVVKKVAP